MKSIKIGLIGLNSGKTSFIQRYINGDFADNVCGSVIMWDNYTKNIKLCNGKDINLQLFDISGYERHKSIAFKLVIRNNGIIIMYNIRNEYSFKDVLYWINEIRDYNDDIPIIIIGNMCDDKERRVINQVINKG